MATGHGLELYQRSPKGQGLRYMGSRKHPTTWCTYSHESRIALLATGEGGLWLQVTPALYTNTHAQTRADAHMQMYKCTHGCMRGQSHPLLQALPLECLHPQLVQSPTTATYCVLQLNLRFDGSCFCVYITGCRHRIFCLPLFVLVYGYKAAVWHISVKNIGVQSQCNGDKQDSKLATLLATLAIS